MKKTLIAIFGRSASGKDTLCDKLCSLIPTANKIKLDTTRPQRPGEPNDAYNFISLEGMMSRLEKNNPSHYIVAEYRRWFYGVNLLEEIEKHDVCIGVFSPKMLNKILTLSVLEKDKFNVIPIYLDISFDEAFMRSVVREDKFKFEMLRRAIADTRDFRGFERKLIDAFGFCIHSNDIAYPVSLLT